MATCFEQARVGAFWKRSPKELVESGTIKTAPLRVQSVLNGLWRQPLGNEGSPYRKDAGLRPQILCPSSTNSR
jgi:hypothetical protein